MATPEELTQQLLQQLASQPTTQLPQLNTGLLAPGQESFKDVLTNPDQAQMNALLGGIIGAFNPNTRSPVGSAAIGALQAFGGQRQREFSQQLALQKAQQEARHQRIQDISALGNLSARQSELGISRDRFGLEQAEFGLKLNSRDSLNIRDPQGNPVDSVVQGPQGGFFKFDENNQPVNVSGQIQQLLSQGYSVTKAGASSTSVTVNTGEGAFAKEFGKQFAEKTIERHGAAQDAVASLQNDVEALSLLDQGIISGAFAQPIVEFGKVLQRLGVTSINDPLAASEAYAASRAQEVGQIIKLFGAGTGLSDKDREFATKAAAGEISMTEESLRRILDINIRAKRNAAVRFNKDFEKIKDKSPFDLTIEVPDLPGQEPPAPVDRKQTISNIKRLLQNGNQ